MAVPADGWDGMGWDEQVVSYLHLLSGPLRPSVSGSVFACSAETIRRCRTIVVDWEEREQKVSLRVRLRIRLFYASYAIRDTSYGGCFSFQPKTEECSYVIVVK